MAPSPRDAGVSKGLMVRVTQVPNGTPPLLVCFVAQGKFAAISLGSEKCSLMVAGIAELVKVPSW